MSGDTRSVECDTRSVECDTFDRFIRQLFGVDPAPSNSIELDVCGDTPSSEVEVFRLLGQILTAGIVYLHGNNIHLQELSATQISRLKQYMASLGYDVWIDDEIDARVADEQYRRYMIPRILSVRDHPGANLYHRIMFCRLLP